MSFLLLGLLPLLQDLVDNPEYKWWASFKEGSSVTCKMTVDGKAQDGTVKVTLKSVGEQSVSVEEARSIRAMGPQRESTRDIMAKITASSILKPEQEGDEEILAGGKKLKCHWKEIRKPLPAGGLEVVRYWIHEDVPGGVVQWKVTLPTGSTAVLTASEWEKK